MIYLPEKDYDIPNIDLLTLLFGMRFRVQLSYLNNLPLIQSPPFRAVMKAL